MPKNTRNRGCLCHINIRSSHCCLNQIASYFYKIIINYLPISAESRLRRPVGADNAYMPARAGFVGNTYTPANEAADMAQHVDTRMLRDYQMRESVALVFMFIIL